MSTATVNNDINSWLSGTGVLSDYAMLGENLVEWNPEGIVLAGVGAGVDTVATMSDPLGSLFSAGIGWLLDHLSPIKDWLNDLTGDASAVEALAGKYDDVAASLETVHGNLSSWIDKDLSGETAQFLEAYREHAREGLLEALEGSRTAQEGMAGSLEGAAAVVDLVHGLVRDALSDIVGHAMSWAAEEFFSLGAATGAVIEQVSAQVAKWVDKLSGTLHALIKAIHELADMVKEFGKAGEALAKVLDKAANQIGKVESKLTSEANHLRTTSHDPHTHRGESKPESTPTHKADGKNDDGAPAPSTKKHKAEGDHATTSVVDQGKQWLVKIGNGTYHVSKEGLPRWVLAEGAYGAAKWVESHPDEYPPAQ